ncbi:hypothetical protein PHET_11194 [Paragonimus heterotremus]|uniref:Vacuolar ATPase assembly integral membrane protein VMA21 n=1 Tax=Paragonimus heterotremus TaxID=100268 RepID=A0A8J4SZZ7_9TREM|nr:hypothetical protein PHET_11194 [Paragonimus heterotremus]
MAVLDPGATRTVVFFSLLIITLPLASFFASKFTFTGFFDVSDSSAYIYGAIVSVVVVHIVLLCFVIVAFSDSKTDVQRKSD